MNEENSIGDRQRDGCVRCDRWSEGEWGAGYRSGEDAMLLAGGAVRLMRRVVRITVRHAVMHAGALIAARGASVVMVMMRVWILRAGEHLRREAIGADLEAEGPIHRRHESRGN